MFSLKNISVKTKIFIFVGIFQLLSIIIAILGTFGLSRMENDFSGIVFLAEGFQQDLNKFRYHISKRKNLLFKVSTASKKDELQDYVTEVKKVEDEINTSFKKMKDFSGLSKLEGKVDNEETDIKKIFSKIEEPIAKYPERTLLIERDMIELLDGATGFYRKQDVKAKIERHASIISKADLDVLEASHTLDVLVNNYILKAKSTMSITSNSVKGILWGGFIICFLVAFALAYVMLRRIAFPIEAAEKMANKFAEGDLTATLVNDAEDEIGRLVRALNKAAKTIATLIKNIGETADHLASSAEELSATSRNLADGATNQASSLEQTASAITEISESISYVSQSAKEQEKEVIETNKYIKDLSRSIGEVIETVKALNEGSQAVLSESKDGQLKVEESVKRMGAIEESSEQISEIIVVINDIFTQTNLLSLNAAIEAARAGESGRGFAVVAEEISKLAARSQKATNEIDELIADSISKVNDGKSIIGQIVESLDKILNKSKEAARLSDNISSQTRIQSQGNEKVINSIKTLSQMAEAISRATAEMDLSAKEISNAIEQVNIVAQNTASSSEEMAASTQELASQSEKLSQLINAFKV